MRTFAVVQARLSSSRLPGKVLLDLGGKPMLQWVVERAARARSLEGVVVATTVDPSDDAVADFCRGRNIRCLRGSLHDVLDRYYQAALTLHADVVVRLTGDCPLIDPAVIDDTVQAFLEVPNADFAANRLPPPFKRTYPIGLDVEVCSVGALERAWREGREPFHREHVMPYFYEDLDCGPDAGMALRQICRSPRGFKVVLVNHHPDYGVHRWTVDTAQDLELVRHILAHLRGDTFTWQDVLALIEREPELRQINAAVQPKTAFDVDDRREGCV
jgi:spore coat polysaccharide biosynthesis protein SpsF